MNTCNLLPNAQGEMDKTCWAQSRTKEGNQTTFAQRTQQHHQPIQLGCQIHEKQDRKEKVTKFQIVFPEKALVSV